MIPSGIFCVAPSCLAVGEEFDLNIKILGPLQVIESANFAWSTLKPKLLGPFNRCVGRKIQYIDNVLPAWNGKLIVDGGNALEGNTTITFDGTRQGVFPGDTRPIGSFGGFRWWKTGFQFIKIIEPLSGVTVYSNPVYVSENKPKKRIFWGDPHWQTFFSDGIRCPEELYAFARDEAFLDFGAISDHMEAISDRQWDYFQSVSNDYYAPGRFVTLIGQEWTNHKDGHRNIYYRGSKGPAIRSTDPSFDNLEKLWKGLDNFTTGRNDAIAIPHHTSNKIMGCDWSLGWNPKYECAAEIYSAWGNSECHSEDGNTRPIKACQGEVKGRHVRDALNLGYKIGFVGGGDIHDGRPGDCLAPFQPEVEGYKDLYPQGLTAAIVPALTRENIFDAIKNRKTYATSQRRIFLDVEKSPSKGKLILNVKTASEDGINDVKLILNGAEIETIHPVDDDRRVASGQFAIDTLGENDYCYVRVNTTAGDMAWCSPFYRE